MKQSILIHLTVPEREPMGPGSFDYRPRSIEDWLQNLPVANLGLTSRTIYESLHSSNRQELPPSMRLHYLEQLREIVRYIGAGLRKQYLGRGLPLRAKPTRIVTLAVRLLQEMALGYEILVETAREHHSLRFSRRHFACALDRAIRYRARVLLENWVVYQPAPVGTWRRLHDLYAITEQSGLGEQRVADPLLDGPHKRSTPAQAYRQVLLLAAAAPQRMHHSDILDAYRLLEHWASAAQLVKADHPRAGEALFRVSFALDEPALPCAIGAPGPQRRFLITNPLLRLIEQEFAGTAKGAFWRRKPLTDINPELSSRLLLALGAVEGRRRQSRMRINTRVQAILGLSAIHRVLSHDLGQEFETVVDPMHERFQSREVHSVDFEERNVWDLIYPTTLNTVTESEQRQPKHDASQHLQPEESLDWSLVNVSAGGYCLVSGPEQNLRAHVGELIAIRDITDGGRPWQLGAVRWMRAMSEQTLQIGMQILALNPSPIQLRAEHSDHRFGPVERGLLLPAMTATDQPATLIAPGRHYMRQRLVRARYGLRESVVELSRELDATAHYVQFEFRDSDVLDTEMAALGGIVPIS
ncbi:MAG: hypothetical protein L0H63_04310 [Nitrococcus sp.]|nr:hypothetical protein [Nitrococcus sp.]